jgi:hypothetical protein
MSVAPLLRTRDEGLERREGPRGVALPHVARRSWRLPRSAAPPRNLSRRDVVVHSRKPPRPSERWNPISLSYSNRIASYFSWGWCGDSFHRNRGYRFDWKGWLRYSIILEFVLGLDLLRSCAVVRSLEETWTRTFWNSPPSRGAEVCVVWGSRSRSIFFPRRQPRRVCCVPLW